MSNEKPIRRSLLDMGIARFAEPAPIQEWAVKSPADEGGLLPASAPILLVGQGGVGKTRAAIELALKIASWDGIRKAPTWMGQKIATAGVSVVLTYEEATDSMHRFIKKMADAAEINPATVGNRMVVKSYQDVDVVPMPLVGNDAKTRQPVKTREYDELTRELREISEQVGNIACIVIDNVGTAFAVDGNDYGSANQAMKWIQRWSAEFGALVIVVAHTNKGALKFETDNPSVNELLAATMGSTGWASAVRAAIMMWTISEEGEAEIAKGLADSDFKPGITKNRYIRARAIKENVEGVYMGTFTLRRAGGTLEDVSGRASKAKSDGINIEIAEFARAIGHAWAQGNPLQKSGMHGVYENRGVLGHPFTKRPKSSLQRLVDEAVAAGAVRLEDAAPGAKGRGKWLFDCSGRGRRDAYLESLGKARRQAAKAKVAFKMEPIGPLGPWRTFLDGTMGNMSDDEIRAAVAELEEAKLIQIADDWIVMRATL